MNRSPSFSELSKHHRFAASSEAGGSREAWHVPGAAIIDGEQQLTFSGQSDCQPALFLDRSFGQEAGCGRSFRGEPSPGLGATSH